MTVNEQSRPSGVSRRTALGFAVGAAGAAMVSAPASASAPSDAGRTSGGAADLVLVNGRVLTMGPGKRPDSAIAVRNGRVLDVGADRDVRRYIGRRTEVVDLRGRTVLPGINDSHLHGLRTGLSLPPYNLDVGSSAVSSIAEIGAVVSEAAAVVPAGSWIRGKGWNEATFAEGRDPNRGDLDPFSPAHPVALLDWSNHKLWANSRALEVAGITASTEAPAGGVIVKDAAGQPTGLLYETAMGLVTSKIPAFTREEQTAAINDNITLLLSRGITSYTEPGIGALAPSIYAELAAAGALRVRVTALLSRDDDTYPVAVDQVREILANFEPSVRDTDRWFRIAGVKLRADGVPIASRTAYMREPYVGGGRGSLVTQGASDEEKSAELAAMIALVDEAGLQVGTHATGDAAIDVVAAAYAAGRRRPRGRSLRHYVIHGDFAQRETLRLLARHGCGISLNPNIKRLIADGQPAVVGPERAAYQTPYATALRAGVMVTSASDSPNVAPHWLQGVETALLREGTSGTVSGPAERIGLEAALRSYTTAGAWQDHAEGWKGSLLPGQVGDLCVLDTSLVDRRGRLAMSARGLSEIGVDLTVVDGAIAYDASDATARAAAASAQAASWATTPSPDGMCASC